MPSEKKTTISVIKADVGSLAGHHITHPRQLEVARQHLEQARKESLIVDFHVTHCGDDLELIMSHQRGENDKEIHELAWNTFIDVTEKVSRPLKLYAAGQDLLADAFSGNVKGMGPGSAELEFEERVATHWSSSLRTKPRQAHGTFPSTRYSPTLLIRLD